nr:MAG TPA: hypothetical protein [Caudoviricetes sp.]
MGLLFLFLKYLLYDTSKLTPRQALPRYKIFTPRQGLPRYKIFTPRQVLPRYKNYRYNAIRAE